jgi:hypothetical protein
MESITQGASRMAAEPVSGAAGAALGWKLLGLGTLVGAGVLGAVIMAIFEPPKDKKTMFGQAAVAGIGSLVFGPTAVRVLDYYAAFIDLANATPLEALETAAPVYLLIGAVSWGAFGALAKLREIIRARAAERIAGMAGVSEDPPVS